MNIYQRLQAVQRKVEYLRKDKQVENYKAVTSDAVVAAVRQHFVEQGIIIRASVVSSQTINTGQTSAKGTPLIRYEGRFSVDFVNVDDPADYAHYEVDAHANDYGDKSPGKAYTYAVKGAVLKALYIETGEDEESRAVKEVVLTEAQEVALQELRDTSLNGTAALKAAWKALDGDTRVALMDALPALKEAADLVDKGSSNGA